MTLFSLLTSMPTTPHGRLPSHVTPVRHAPPVLSRYEVMRKEGYLRHARCNLDGNCRIISSTIGHAQHIRGWQSLIGGPRG